MKLVVLALLLCTGVCDGGTLVSYIYYRPDKLGEPLKQWSKCAFRDRLCGCSTSMKHGQGGEVGVDDSGLTLCTEAMCYCRGSGGRQAQMDQCTSNLVFFVNHGLTPDLLANESQVTFLFNIVGDTVAPPELVEKAEMYPTKVLIKKVPMAMTDLCTQGNVVRANKDTYSKFALINCSARGPYVTGWLNKFENVFQEFNDVHLTGPVINCFEKQPHVQSWMWYADSVAAEIIASKCWCDGTRNEQIQQCEVGVSSALLASNSNIASLQPAYLRKDFRDPTNHQCNRGRSPVGCSKTDPPTSLACRGAQPCYEVFVKYGGNNIPLGFIPPITHERISALDSRGGVCTSYEEVQ